MIEDLKTLGIVAVAFTLIFGAVFVKDRVGGEENVGLALYLPVQLNSVDTAGDGECLSYQSATSKFEWISCGGAGGSTLHVDATGSVYPADGDYHSAPYYTATSTATASTFPFASTTALTATNLFGALTGNADTATALAANGGNCAAGEIALGVDTAGAVEGCYEPTEGDITDLAHLTFPWTPTALGNSTSTLLQLTAGALITGSSTVTGQLNVWDEGTGAHDAFDATFGDPDDYGAIQIGNTEIYSSSFSASNLDLDKAFLLRQTGNIGAGNDPGIEFAWMEQGNAVRMAIPESGAGNATAMIRSVTIAGPYAAATGNNIVLCDTWSTYNTNIDCDTGGTGADLFVQDDLEVEGELYLSGSIYGDADDASQHQIVFANATADHILTIPDDTIASGDLLVGSGAGTFVYTAKGSINLGDFNDNLTHYVDADVSTYLTGGTGITESGGTLTFDCSEVEGVGINCATEAITLDLSLNNAWTGTGTTTFAGDIDVADAMEAGYFTGTGATSTFANGLDLTTGCLAYNGTCITVETITAGDYLTKTASDIDLDVEIYTETFTFSIASSTLSTTTSATQHKLPNAITITRATCSTNAGTTSLQVDERAEATPNTAGTDVFTDSFSCGSGFTNATSSFSNASITADNILNLDVDTTDDQSSGATPTNAFLHIEYTIDD